jgi:hypothetical protein
MLISLQNTRFNFNYFLGIIILLPSTNSPELHNSTTILRSVWHLDRNWVLVQVNDYKSQSYCGTTMRFPKVVIGVLTCTPVHSSLDKGSHLQVQLECRQYCAEQYSHPADLIQLLSTSTSFWNTSVSPPQPPHNQISVGSGNREIWYPWITDWITLPEISNNKSEPGDQCIDLSNSRSIEVKAPIGLKQMGCSFKPLAKGKVLAVFRLLSKWRK